MKIAARYDLPVTDPGLQNDPMHPGFLPPRRPLWQSLVLDAIGPLLLVIGLIIYLILG